ncbi:unnamed protein product [Miscanthus lutarioriparius]|uniref:Uncharacterized protein n=1 Tax=Miscanthus lutarioriparius TaxID=422564 RepID=A0A811PRR1_9POAL|nr:unnamed protein product [Miscanthus lutarioriparius]
MVRKDEEEGPADRVPHLPWMRYPVDIDTFSGCPVTLLPRLDPRICRDQEDDDSGGKKQDALPASLRLGASLVMLLSKSTTELRRTVEQDGGAEGPDGAPASRRQGTCVAAMAIAQTAPASSRSQSDGRPPCWRDRQRRREPRPRGGGGGGLRPHADEGNRIKSPPHGGMSALELERRLHQLRHEARIAELGCEANGGGGKGSTWAR